MSDIDILDALVRALTDQQNAAKPQSVNAEDEALDRAVTSLTNLLRQAPMSFRQRRDLLADFTQAMPMLRSDRPGDLIATAAQLHDAVLRIPLVERDAVRLPVLDKSLDAAYRMLIELDRDVSEPWTLIGGLMVFTHCAEHDAPFTRPTGDADVAVSVFTHRRALANLTRRLREASFSDVTPGSPVGGPQMSYRWARDSVTIDVAVPARANEQQRRPETASGRAAVELPAIQQALRRTERLQVVLSGGEQGFVRRPDLLAAIVIKAVASRSDTRNPDRHREDLVALADILAISGAHVSYAPQMRNKDRHRILSALELVTQRQWAAARDPEAAEGALRFLAAVPMRDPSGLQSADD